MYVSPQYYMVFDYPFSTVPSLYARDILPKREALVDNITESVTDEAFDLASTWLSGSNVPHQGGTPNEEVLDVSQSDPIASDRISFADHIDQFATSSNAVLASEETLIVVSKVKPRSFRGR